MPYDISHPDDHTWCVVKSETGEKVHCYPTKKEALDLLAALESNVPDASVRTFERRVFPLQDARVTRADDKTGVLRFHGRPWVYEQLSEDMGGWQEVIRPGAATRTLAADPDVRFLINHNADLLLGRTASGTLHLSEDEAGGIADAQMANVSYARDLAELIDRGDLTQMSFGFWITNDSWSGNLHEVHGFDLDGGDVSAVTFPAFPQTSSGLRERAQRQLQRIAPEPPVDERDEGYPLDRAKHRLHELELLSQI